MLIVSYIVELKSDLFHFGIWLSLWFDGVYSNYLNLKGVNNRIA